MNNAGLRSSEKCCRVAWWTGISASEEPFASIFMVELFYLPNYTASLPRIP